MAKEERKISKKKQKLLSAIATEIYDSGVIASYRSNDIASAIEDYVFFEMKKNKKKTKNLIAKMVDDALAKYDFNREVK